jgi:DNA polymerase III subunit epsilon
MNVTWLKSLWGNKTMHPNRWVVLDVETTGLNTRKASLLEIAALSIWLDPVGQTLKIDIADSFGVVLKQQDADSSNKENILLHGIGVHAQKAGEDPALALLQFKEWIGDSPLFAFHAMFDEAMIQKTCKHYLGYKLKNAWIDIEPLVAKCHPNTKAKYMDDWMRHLGIECTVRHQAAADTFATAEIVLQIWPILRQYANTIESIEQLEKRLRQLPRG